MTNDLVWEICSCIQMLICCSSGYVPCFWSRETRSGLFVELQTKALDWRPDFFSWLRSGFHAPSMTLERRQVTQSQVCSGAWTALFSFFTLITRSAATNTAPFQPLILLRWNNHLISFLLALPLSHPSRFLSLVSTLYCMEVQSVFSPFVCNYSEAKWIRPKC